MTYLDSSTILDRIVDAPGAKETWREIGNTVTSVWTEVECLRALDRFRLLGQMDEVANLRGREALFAILGTTEAIALGRSVLDRAALPFPFVIKALDAIHLSSAMVYRDTMGPVTIATNDHALARAARGMGFEVLGAA